MYLLNIANQLRHHAGSDKCLKNHCALHGPRVLPRTPFRNCWLMDHLPKLHLNGHGEIVQAKAFALPSWTAVLNVITLPWEIASAGVLSLNTMRKPRIITASNQMISPWMFQVMEPLAQASSIPLLLKRKFTVYACLAATWADAPFSSPPAWIGQLKMICRWSILV